MCPVSRSIRNSLFSALRADKAVLVQHDKAHPPAKAQMSQSNRVFGVNVRPAVAVRTAVVVDVKIQILVEPICVLATFRGLHTCTGIYTIRQHWWNDQTFFKICTCILYLVCSIVHVWNLHDRIIHPPRCNTIMREIPFFVTTVLRMVSYKFFLWTKISFENHSPLTV